MSGYVRKSLRGTHGDLSIGAGGFRRAVTPEPLESGLSGHPGDPPTLLWWILLSIPAGFLILIGWFCALVLGRLPRSFVRPLSDYIVYTVRMYSYLNLMNDAYPPFSAKKDFGVNIEIPSTDVRRLAVLFRIILIIPAAIVSGLVSIGVEVAAIFIWLIVLVKGEMPLSLFGALAAVWRFQARFYAYYMMITAKYPGELFGDESPLADTPWPTPPSAYSPASSVTNAPVPFGSAPAATSESIDESAEPTATGATTEPGLAFTPAPPIGMPTMFPSDASSSALEEAPKTARLILSRGSKRILVVFLILGAVGYAANLVLQNKLRDNRSALSQLTAANNTLNNAVLSAKTQKNSCTLGANACLQAYFVAITDDFNAFEGSLNAINFPSSAQADATQFKGATTAFVGVLRKLEATPSSPADLSKLSSLGNAFDTDFQQVLNDLSSPI